MGRRFANTVVSIALLLILRLSHIVDGSTYFIPPSYPAPPIPRGYQPPPSGIPVDEYAYSGGAPTQQSQQPQQYTIMRFNSREPYPPPAQQQPQASWPNQQQQSWPGEQQQQQKTWPSQQQQTWTSQQQVQPSDNSFRPPPQIQSSLDSRSTSNFGPNSNDFNPSIERVLPTKHHDPMLINTLIQVFSGDAQERTISLAEARSMTAIDGGSTTVDAIASNPNRVVILRKLDTQTRSFLPSVNSATGNGQRYVIAKAFAASNSSAVSKVDLESELNKELEASIPLIIGELEKIQHQTTAKTLPSEPLFTTSNTTAITTVSTEQTTENDVHSADLERLIAEGLAEVDEPKSTATPLLVFTKTSPLTKEPATSPIFSLSTTALVSESSDAEETRSTPAGVTSTSSGIPEAAEEDSTTAPATTVSGIVNSPTSVAQQTPENHGDETLATTSHDFTTENVSTTSKISETETKTLTAVPEQSTSEKPTENSSIDETSTESSTNIVTAESTIRSDNVITTTTESNHNKHIVIEELLPHQPERQTEQTENQMEVLTETSDDYTTSVQSTMITEVAEDSTSESPASESVTTHELSSSESTHSTSQPSEHEILDTTVTPITTSSDSVELSTSQTTESQFISSVEFNLDENALSSTSPADETTPTVDVTPTVGEPASETETSVASSKSDVTTTGSVSSDSVSSTTIDQATTQATDSAATDSADTTQDNSEHSTITTAISEMPEIIGTMTMDNETCSTNQSDSAAKGDVLFLLDGSSGNNSQFRQNVELIWDTVKEFGNDFGPNGIQVSLVQHNKDPSLEFSFRGHKCLDGILDDIFDTQRVEGASNIGRAVDKVLTSAFTSGRGDRPNVPNVLVLITNGAADAEKVRFPSELSSNGDTTVLVIASVEVSAEEFAMLMLNDGSTPKNRFNVTELDSKVPLARRLSDRIREVLKGNHQRVIVTNSGTILSSMPEDKKTSESTSEPSDSTEKLHTTEFSHDDSASTSLNDLSSMSELSDSSTTPTSLSNPADEDVSPLPSQSDGDRVPVPLDDVAVAVDCLAGGIRANFTLPTHFRGSIVAKDFELDEKCVTEINSIGSESNDPHIESVEIHHPDCGLHFMKSDHPRGINESIVLSIVHDRRLVTGLDRSFVLQCFIPLSVTTIAGGKPSSDNALATPSGGIPEAEELETDLTIVPGMALSKTISVVGTPPKCSYSLRRDSPNGAVAQTAQVGTTLYHRWECENVAGAENAFGLHIYDCRAKNQQNSSSNYQFVDEKGCATDSALVEDVTYADDRLVAYSRANVFTLQDVGALRFSCKAALCVRDGDRCEGYSPPLCGANASTALLASHQLRQLDSSIEAALSSDLDAPQLMVLASTGQSDPHRNYGGAPRMFASPTRLKPGRAAGAANSRSFGFAVGVLMCSIVLGLLLGVLCFGICRCVDWCRRGSDDRASLVETATGSFGRRDYASQRDGDGNSICDALSFSGQPNSAPAIVEEDDCDGLQNAYRSTLERRAGRASALNASTASLASADAAAASNTEESANSNYARNLVTATDPQTQRTAK